MKTTIKRRRIVTEDVPVEIVDIKEISPRSTPSMNQLRCGSCLETIGDKRPIALAWVRNDDGQGEPLRFCNGCLGKVEKVAE